ARVAAEAALPETVLEDGHRAAIGILLVGGEAAPEPGRDAEDLEEARRDVERLHAHRLADAGQGGGLAAPGREVLEDLVLIAPGDEVRRRGREARELRRVRLHHADEALGFAVGQAAEEERVDDAEDGDGGADAERPGEERRDGEARLAPKHAE